MFLADHARVLDREHAVEARLGKRLAPGPAVAQRLRGFERDLVARELAVGLDAIRRNRRDRASASPPASNARANASRWRSSSDSPAAIAWPPKRLMSSGWRAAMPSSTSRMWMPGTERAEPRSAPSSLRANAMTGRRMRSLMRLATSPTTPWCQSGSNRHTPWRVGPRRGSRKRLHRGERRDLHARLDLAALGVQRIEPRRERQRFGLRVREQAADADRHVVEPAGRVEPRTDREPQIRGGELRARCACRSSSSARMPGTARPARMRRMPCATSTRLLTSSGTRSATVPSATRSRKSRDRRHDHRAARIELAAHRGHHVERHADAGERARAEAAARHVGIHDDVGGGQRRARQVMIGDQHLDAARARRGDAGIAGDAVVDGDDERRRALGGEPHDLRREPVAELEAVRHQEIDRRETPGAQAAHDERGARGAVGIEVADDEDAALAMLEDQRRPPRRRCRACPPA